MKENIIVDKSYAFAVLIVRFCRVLQLSEKEYIMSRQLLKSGTSIGANIEEAQGAISKPEFISKIQISLKEARETKYWLRLIRDSDINKSSSLNELLISCQELIAILSSILITSKQSRK